MARWTLRTLVILGIQLGVMTAALATTDPDTQPVRLPINVNTTSHQRVVVVAGDHLWKISSRHLKKGVVENPDVATYWRAVIDLNSDDLRSGNPNLIYPGEVISFPPMSSANG
jgi:nucleoid-associated protein YgaU